MSAVRGSLVLVVASLLLLLGAAPAAAQDANTVPPQVKLTAAGIEGILGPSKSTLAYFSTEAPEPSWEYAPDSKVTFACAIDGAAIPCAGTYDGCCSSRVAEAFSSRATPRSLAADTRTAGLGIYSGTVPLPKKLAGGVHTVTVTATDEDGAGAPASVEVTVDKTPPSAPRLLQPPARRSHDHKPIFRYTATDDVRLVAARNEPFFSVLRRLDPRERIFRSRFDGGYIGTWIPQCRTLVTCTGRTAASYEAGERNYGFGVPEWLPAGLYEFEVRARDAVGNLSPFTRYRFHILPGGH